MSARPAASGGAAARRAAIALCTDPEGWCWGGSERQAADAERGLSVLLFAFFLSFFSLFFFYSFFFSAVLLLAESGWRAAPARQ